jgi:hypothetical protein
LVFHVCFGQFSIVLVFSSPAIFTGGENRHFSIPHLVTCYLVTVDSQYSISYFSAFGFPKGAISTFKMPHHEESDNSSFRIPAAGSGHQSGALLGIGSECEG